MTLGNFATASFDPRTDGIVQSFDVVSVSDEKIAPLPLKQYAKAVEDAKEADAAFSTEKRTYQNANIVAIDRVLKTVAAGKAVSAKDVAVKDAWEKWSDRRAQPQEGRVRGAAPPQQRARPGRTEPEPPQRRDRRCHVSTTVSWSPRKSPSMRRFASPQGQTATKPMKAMLQRAVVKNEKGEDLKGRWIVTSVAPA